MPRAGDIGPAKEIEFEPMTEPAAPEPVRTPSPTPAPVKEPAHV